MSPSGVWGKAPDSFITIYYYFLLHPPEHAMAFKAYRLIAASCERTFVRVLLLAGVCAVVGLAFQWNFERHMLRLNAGYLQDSAGLLSRTERKQLADMRTAVRQLLGMELLVRVEQGTAAVQVPVFPASTIFVGANPHKGEAVIVLPPLAKKVLGEGQRLLVEERLATCMRDKALGRCLEESAQSLLEQLTDPK